MNKQLVTTVGVFVGGLAAGTVGGYIFAKKKFAKIADEEIASVKERFALLRKDDYPTPESLLDKTLSDIQDDRPLEEEHADEHDEDGNFTGHVDALEREAFDQEIADLGYTTQEERAFSTEDFGSKVKGWSTPVSVQAEGSPIIESSVFEGDPGSKPSDVVMPEVDILRPYIITVDQYMEDDEPPFAKLNLIYWEGDDTLADERETIIPEANSLVGDANLHKFGHGSKDRNIVYIRNHKIESDFEVVRDPRKFAEVVLHIRQSPDRVSVRRMRSGDDE